MKISGKFEVELKPLENYAKSAQPNQLGRMSIEKTYDGALSATSQGEMLTARTQVASSAGYVAIEEVTGSLENREGSFVLQHFGLMSSGNDHLVLEVVPDSGTGQLTGLSGKMAIRIEEGQHFYDFEFELPEQ